MSSLTAVSREGVGDGQRLTCADVAVWRHLRVYVAVREMEQACKARGSVGTGVWEHVRDTDDAWSPCSWGRNFSRRVWCCFWPFLVGFCAGLAVLSSYAFSLAVEWAKRWYLRVAGTVGVTAVTRFWQWLLDEGEGSGRTPEMSIGTRKSEEWLWYHVNNIKWERKTE